MFLKILMKFRIIQFNYSILQIVEVKIIFIAGEEKLTYFLGENYF